MGNRKLPFGYQMELGKAAVHPSEGALVQTIFQQYALGASYLELVNALRNQSVPYAQGKVWNKNMIARILENERYSGHLDCPQLISEELFDAVTNKRAVKITPPQKTEAQKALRQLSQERVTQRLEHQVLAQLNALIDQPERIRMPSVLSASDRVTNLQRMLEDILIQQPIDEEIAWQHIADLAAAQYDQIDSAEYETLRIRRCLSLVKQMEALNAELLRSIVSAIRLGGNGTVSIQLKNGQTFGGAHT